MKGYNIHILLKSLREKWHERHYGVLEAQTVGEIIHRNQKRKPNIAIQTHAMDGFPNNRVLPPIR
jgi:hypothetical protein